MIITWIMLNLHPLNRRSIYIPDFRKQQRMFAHFLHDVDLLFDKK